MNKNICVLGGANNPQEIIKHFTRLDWNLIIGNELKFDKIYCFEPLREFATWIKDVKPEYEVEIEYINKALWVEDGHITFYRTPHHFSSTLCPDKANINGIVDEYDVECIDFSQWLTRHISPDDTVIVDIDIECAEYKILPKLISDGTIELIDHLSVEFHGEGKCKNWFNEGSNNSNGDTLKKELANHVNLLDHDAIIATLN